MKIFIFVIAVFVASTVSAFQSCNDQIKHYHECIYEKRLAAHQNKSARLAELNGQLDECFTS